MVYFGTLSPVHTSNNVEAIGNNVKATFDFVERIVRLVAFDNVASTLLLVWTGVYLSKAMLHCFCTTVRNRKPGNCVFPFKRCMLLSDFNRSLINFFNLVDLKLILLLLYDSLAGNQSCTP